MVRRIDCVSACATCWLLAARLTPIIDAVEYFDLFFRVIGASSV